MTGLPSYFKEVVVVNRPPLYLEAEAKVKRKHNQLQIDMRNMPSSRWQKLGRDDKGIVQNAKTTEIFFSA